ncbi:MAG: cytochrome c [Anderseniella sp.]
MKRTLILAIAVFALIALSLGYRAYQPPKTAQTGETGNPIVSVSVPVLNAAAREGEGMFNAKCATCHGKNAAGQEGVAPPLVHVIYEPNHHADLSFRRAIQSGVRQHHWPFGDMPPVADVTSDEAQKIIGYVRSLQKANGIF